MKSIVYESCPIRDDAEVVDTRFDDAEPEILPCPNPEPCAEHPRAVQKSSTSYDERMMEDQRAFLMGFVDEKNPQDLLRKVKPQGGVIIGISDDGKSVSVESFLPKDVTLDRTEFIHKLHDFLAEKLKFAEGGF